MWNRDKKMRKKRKEKTRNKDERKNRNGKMRRKKKEGKKNNDNRKNR